MSRPAGLANTRNSAQIVNSFVNYSQIAGKVVTELTKQSLLFLYFLDKLTGAKNANPNVFNRYRQHAGRHRRKLHD